MAIARPSSVSENQWIEWLTLQEAGVEDTAKLEHVIQPDVVEALRCQLESLAVELRNPTPPDPFAEESACLRVLDFVETLGLQPSQVSDDQQFSAATALEPALGSIRDYQLLAKLGQGGMGVVYKALHVRLKKIVALKVLPIERMRDARSVSRFEREMEAVGKLDHPYIVRATDAGQHDGTHYLVMEYVAGRDLSAITRACGPLPIADACELVRQAAVGLQYVHENGRVHRDIKPSNLMLTPDGTVKILDMGLALLERRVAADSGELTASGQWMGTLDYLAPEQGSDSHEVDIRADIYSLGATLYRLLTGRPPLGDPRYDSPIKKLTALATQDPPLVRQLRPDIPAALEAIVMRMLRRRPERRYITPAEVAAALSPLCAGSNLPALCATAETALDRAAEASRSTSTLDRIAPGGDTASVAPAVERERALTTAAPRRRRVPPWLIATAAGLAAIALGVIIIIRNREGKEVARVEVTDGDSATIVDSDNPPASKESSEPAIEPAPAKQIAWQPGEGAEQSFLGYLRQPAALPGIKRWQVQTVWPNSGVNELRWSPDGKWLVCRSHEGVRVYEYVQGGLKLACILPPGRSTAWSPDSKTLAIGGREVAVRFWDIATATQTGSLEVPGYDNDGGPDALAWHPKDKLLALSIGSEPILLCNVDGSNRKFLKGHTSGQCYLAWSHDGRQLASCSLGEPEVRLWNEDGTAGPVLKTKNPAWQVAWSPDDELVAAVTGHEVYGWSRAGGEPRTILAVGEVNAVGFSSDGAFLAGATIDGGIRLWVVKSWNEIHRINGEDPRGIPVMACHPREKLIAVGAVRLRLYDVERQSMRFAAGRFRIPAPIDWSADGKRIATGTEEADGIVHTFHADGRMERFFRTGTRTTVGAALSKDGKLLAIWTHNDNAIQLWDRATGKVQRVLRGHPTNVETLVWGADGSFASAGGDGDIRLWKSTEKSPFKVIERPEGSSRFVWSRDGARFAALDRDGKLSVFDARSGEQVAVLEEKEGEHIGHDRLLWSGDGRRVIVSRARQTRVFAWDWSDNEIVWQVISEAGGTVGTLSPDGDVILGAIGSQPAFLDAETGQRLPVEIPADYSHRLSSSAWGPDEQLLFGDSLGALHAFRYRAETLTPLWTSVLVGEDKAAVFTPAGRLTNPDPTFDEELVYYLEHDNGRLELLKPSQFNARFPGAFAPALATRPAGLTDGPHVPSQSLPSKADDPDR